ncbi:MAG: hypothetical protein KAS07_01035 [Candidatus Pacebacteria bacterium]|nr:hypothetical protein [Candidatus Paceibacterota bacterium]
MKYNKAGMNTAAIILVGGISMALFGVLALGVLYQTKNSTQEDIYAEEDVFSVPRSIVTELGIETVVHQYLKEKIAISSFGDETFCSFEVLGHEESKDKLFLYLWTLCSELYVAEGEIKEGGGVSEPLVLVLKKEGKSYNVAEHKEPESGSRYTQSAQELFPEEYHEKVLPSQISQQVVNDRYKFLSYWVREQGKEFYGVK